MEEKVTIENEKAKAGVEDQNVKPAWSSTQVYTLSVVCLLVGLAVGFLLRGSTAPQAPAQQAATTAAPPPMNAPAQPSGMQTPPMQPTPEQLKAMAEKKAEPYLQTLKTNPNDTESLTKVGSYYMAAGQFDEAAKYFEKAVAVKPTADAWTKLSNAQAYGGDGEKAISSLNKALEIDPKYADALFNLGVLKWKARGDTKGAIATWEKLIKTNPDNPKIEQVKQIVAHVKQEQKTQPASMPR